MTLTNNQIITEFLETEKFYKFVPVWSAAFGEIIEFVAWLVVRNDLVFYIYPRFTLLWYFIAWIQSLELGKNDHNDSVSY